jgi:hypothetical protein
MSNPEIEYFTRWQKVYLMWAYSNFDRIVTETVKKHSVKPIVVKIDYNLIFA